RLLGRPLLGERRKRGDRGEQGRGERARDPHGNPPPGILPGPAAQSSTARVDRKTRKKYAPRMTLADKLKRLAQNLWWTWRQDVRAIFRDLDAELFRSVHRNPIAFLKRVNAADLEERAHDLEIHARVDRALRQLEEYLTPLTTWALTHAGALQARPV